jgi:outer membrane protein
MKKIILAILISLSCINISYAELKIGYVRVDQILKDAPQAAESNKKLDSEFKIRTEKLKKDISNLNEKEKSFKKDSLTMSDSDKEKKQKSIIDQRIDIQRSERELREDIDLRRREEITKLQNKITAVIQTIADRDKYDLILYTGVAFASTQIDMTPIILKELAK